MRLLNDTYRKKAIDKNDHHLRIIALSATLPNVSDIGQWLQAPDSHMHQFDEAYRPVPLRTHVISYPPIPSKTG